jgi:hypothetical protein
LTSTEQRSTEPVAPYFLAEPVSDLWPLPTAPSLEDAPFPFLDFQSFQTDFLDGYRHAPQPECWLLERRKDPVVVSDEAADQEALRGASPDWLEWLCQFGSALRAVRVDHPKDRGELETLCSEGVEVRLVSEARAARSVLPNMLILGRRRAYVFTYEVGVFVGAVRVDDRKLISRWWSGVAKLHAHGARPDEVVRV